MRLFAARVTVHFQSFVDKFSPHDSIFAIIEASELKETALSAACSLHAASGSISSSTSSARRRRLGEIVEDVEDTRSTKSASDKPLPPLPYQLPVPRDQPDRKTLRVETDSLITERADYDVTLAGPQSSKGQDHDRASSNATVPLILGQIITTPEYMQSEILATTQGGPEASGSSRPTSQDEYFKSLYSTKPKVKLGPRPSMDAKRRPHTSGTVPTRNENRPISTLPAGIRVAQRKAPATSFPNRPQYQYHRSATSFNPPQSPLSHLAMLSTSIPERPVTSPNPGKSNHAQSASSAPEVPRLTPEKQRLMKALELRKKQLELQSQEMADSLTDKVHQIDGVDKAEEDKLELQPQELVDSSIDKVHQSDDADKAKEEQLELQSQELVDSSTDKVHQSDDPDKAREEESDYIPLENFSEAAKDAVVAENDGSSPKPVANGTVSLTKSQDEDHVGFAAGHSPEESAVQHTDPSPFSSEHSPELTSTKASSVASDAESQLSVLTEHVPESDVILMGIAIAGSGQGAKSGIDIKEPVVEGFEASALELPPTSNSMGALTEISENVVPSQHKETTEKGPLASGLATQSPIQESNEVIASPEGAVSIFVEEESEVHNPEHKPELEYTNGIDPTREPEEAKLSSDDITTGVRIDSRRGSYHDNRLGSRKKRKVLLDPIRTDISTENSDDNLLSDDSLMDELNSATFEEAKPVSVGRSPHASIFSRSPSESQSPNTRAEYRAVSNPGSDSKSQDTLRNVALTVPGNGTPRSGSGQHFAGDSDSQGPIAVIKKVNVSSGISQRIKALERVSSKSSRAESTTPPSSSPHTSSPSFPALRSAALRSASAGSASASPSPNKPNGLPFSAKLDSLSSSRQPSNAISHGSEDTQVQSVSVKAQIVRGIKNFHSKSQQGMQNPVDPQPLELHKSPLTIEHRNGSVDFNESSFESAKQEDSQTTFSSPASPKAGVSSPTEHRRPSLASLYSNSGRSRNQAKSPPSTSTSLSTYQADGDGGNETKKETKRESTTSRFFRRVSSSISASSRKNSVPSLSPTRIDESVDPTEKSGQKRMSVEVGDVNVQFPDNLVRTRYCNDWLRTH